MKEIIKRNTIQFFKEMIPVIAGILIALFIDNWNSDRKDKNYINQVFTTVNNELKDSKEDLKTTIAQPKSLIDSLNYYSNNKNFTLSEIILKSNGIKIPQIKTTAWKSVSNSKIDLIDYEKITILSTIDEQKEAINNKSQFLMTYIYSNANETDKNKKENLKLILMDIIQTEKTTQQFIELFEKK